MGYPIYFARKLTKILFMTTLIGGREYNGIIVKDDIETGHGSVIPLWYFGMNY